MKINITGLILMLVVSHAAVSQSADETSSAGKELSNAVAALPAKPNAIKPVIEPTTGMEFVLVKGGCFQMGDIFGDGNSDEKPAHEVCVADYYLGKFEVTQAQWEKIMGKNPSFNSSCGGDCPVESISWNMAQEFIGKLNSKGSVQYRLPTEAEWEYAARSGGKKEKWAGTSDENALEEFAWYDKDNNTPTQKVGTKKPNSLGLFDMSSNVIEWCQDYYDEAYYAVSPKDNPVGPANGQKRVLRGGNIGRDAKELRTTQRVGDDPEVWDGSYGLRLLRPAR